MTQLIYKLYFVLGMGLISIVSYLSGNSVEYILLKVIVSLIILFIAGKICILSIKQTQNKKEKDNNIKNK